MWTIRIKSEEGVTELPRFDGNGVELITMLAALSEAEQESIESIIRLPS